MTLSCELFRSCTNAASRFAVTEISSPLQVIDFLGAGGPQTYDSAVYLGILSFASLSETLERVVRIDTLFSGISVRRRFPDGSPRLDTADRGNHGLSF